MSTRLTDNEIWCMKNMRYFGFTLTDIHDWKRRLPLQRLVKKGMCTEAYEDNHVIYELTVTGRAALEATK